MHCDFYDWFSGEGFASGIINLGEITVYKISQFQLVWSCNSPQDIKNGVSFYKPVGIPDGFYTLGHYCQFNNHPLRGFLLVASEPQVDQAVSTPALCKPLDFTLVWSSDEESEETYDGCGFFWLPQPPDGYKALGFFVTKTAKKPDLDEVRCVRADLTDKCEPYRLMLDTNSKVSHCPFRVWSARPFHRGLPGRGVFVGTFYCSSYWITGEDLSIACLENLDPRLHAMPNLDQIHALIKHYGPTVFFHPEEVYLPSSVSWFFENGALLYKAGDETGEAIDSHGTNLPGGGTNDHEFWIDLPRDDRRKKVKCGNLESAKLYSHVKPASGGTFTDIAMWVFCPFNGPATLKVGMMNFALSKVGRHVGDWEHFTLRICNFTGELWSIYFSQHSGGKWVDAYDLEYAEGNKAIVYSSRNGHASFPHPGTYIQGSRKLGVGIRNDAYRSSNVYLDSSSNYEIIAGEYLGDGVVTEPCWLQFMREWGPRIVYDSRAELEKVVKRLPAVFRNSVENIFRKLPVELSGEEGPTGPKEKNNWVGDERG